MDALEVRSGQGNLCITRPHRLSSYHCSTDLHRPLHDTRELDILVNLIYIKAEKLDLPLWLLIIGSCHLQSGTISVICPLGIVLDWCPVGISLCVLLSAIFQLCHEGLYNKIRARKCILWSADLQPQMGFSKWLQ